MTKNISIPIITLLLLTVPSTLIAGIYEVKHTNTIEYHKMPGFGSQESSTKSNPKEKNSILPMPIPWIDIDLNSTTDINTSSIVKSKKVSEENLTGVYKKYIENNSSSNENNISESFYKDNLDTEDIRQKSIRVKSQPSSRKSNRASKSLLPIAGKIYFTRKGQAMSCTASLIDRADILLTAAHCLCSGNVIHNSIEYYPFTRENSTQHYKASKFAIPEQWGCGSDYAYDFGFIKLSKPVKGKRVDLRSDINPAKKSQVVAYGYPQGNILYQASGQYSYTTYTTQNTRNYIYMVNNLRSGSSGGPWVNSVGKVVGINSFHPTNNFSLMYSPYFSEIFAKLLKEFY